MNVSKVFFFSLFSDQINLNFETYIWRIILGVHLNKMAIDGPKKAEEWRPIP